MIRVVNPAGQTARQWVDVVVPNHMVDPNADPLAAKVTVGEESRWASAVRGEPAGKHATEWHLQMELPPTTVAKVELLPDPTGLHQHRFKRSTWVWDDISALMPRLKVVALDANGNMVEHWSEEPQLETPEHKPDSFVRLVQQNEARMFVHIRTQVPALRLVLDFYAWVYSDQDSVPFEATVTLGGWPEQLSQWVQGMWLYCGEFIHMDYRVRKGMPMPEHEPGVAGLWRQQILEARDMGRAQQIDVQGALLCLPTAISAGTDFRQGLRATDVVYDTSRRFEALVARMAAPMLGCAESFEPFGAFGMPPRVPAGANGWQEAQMRLQRFMHDLNTQGDITDLRRYGLAKRPANTGGQEDFGVVKASMLAAVGHPASMYELRYCAEGWQMRYEHNREPNGAPVKSEDHPNCIQFGHVPDSRVSRDLLGWPGQNRPYSWPHLGWIPMDDQHYSINGLVGLYQFDRSPVIAQTLDDLMALDEMENDLWNRTGAPRAVGRRMLAWAHIAAIGDPHHQQKAEALIRELNGDMHIHADYIKQGFAGNAHKTVRVHDPFQAKYGWVDENGNLIKCWVCWEHAFVCTGYYGAWKQVGDPALREVALEIGKTVVRHAFFREGGRWHCCYAVRSVLDENGNHTGEPLPASLYRLGENPDVVVEDGFFKWTLGACVVVATEDPDSVEGVRARRILHEVVGPAPRAWDESEWLSCGSW